MRLLTDFFCQVNTTRDVFNSYVEFQKSMRISHGKSRTPLPPDMTADNTASGASKGNHSSSFHDSTFTSYGASELTPVTSASSAATASDLDVNALTDDELRERFKSVMVCFCIFQNRQYYIYSRL